MTTAAITSAEPSAAKLPAGFVALAVLTAILLAVAVYFIFMVAPVELQMGIVQKIFYFHVPSAYSMYVGFTCCVIGSGVFLWKRNDTAEAIAVAGAEVGTVFCIIVLITGPLWGRKAWGTYWTWDPRLTTTLLISMVYVAYLLLRNLGATGEAERRFAAGLGLMGGFLMPIINQSVKIWRGQHPTVMTGKGGGLHPDMRPALILSFVAFTALVALLIWARASAERARQRIHALELDAAELGLLEDHS
jgi:heme exporter protein C